MRFSLIIVVLAFAAALAGTVYVGDDSARHRQDEFKNGYYNDLQTAIDKAGNGDTIRIAPGVFYAKSFAYPESLCGNCEDHITKVEATRGFLIEDKSLIIIGCQLPFRFW